MRPAIVPAATMPTVPTPAAVLRGRWDRSNHHRYDRGHDQGAELRHNCLPPRPEHYI
jgi:hypothetical protein